MKRMIPVPAVFAVILIALGWLAVREMQMRRDLRAAIAANDSFAEQVRELNGRVDGLTRELEKQRMETAMAFPMSAPEAIVVAAVSNRIAAVENAIRKTTAMRVDAIGNVAATDQNVVPEYDPTQPPPPNAGSQNGQSATVADRSAPRRNWGQEQATGAPDTHAAGDIPTAWASLQPDGGPEWLAAGFDKATEISEIRIRETYNPGAISRVTAFVNGEEVTLWEGNASGGQAPRDFVVRPPFDVRADSVVVHLDTTRVTGWNEIDAIELVGKDGSRQWASSANASSTYAEQPVVQNPSRTQQ